jgi:transposase
MLSLSPSVRVFVARECVDFRKGFDGLCGIVRDHLGGDPLSGHLYLFVNRRRDRVKVLVWDRNGFWLFYKRLEAGRFERIDGESNHVEIDRARMAMLLDGIELKNTRMRRHFVRELSMLTRDEAGR